MKKGGRLQSESSFKEFKTMLQVCDMQDLPYTGNPFSLVGRRRSDIIDCCLDRTLVNSEWKTLYSASTTEFLELAESDHRPLIVTIEYEAIKRRGQFCYDKWMFRYEAFSDIVISHWNNTRCTSTGFSSQMGSCRSAIVK